MIKYGAALLGALATSSSAHELFLEQEKPIVMPMRLRQGLCQGVENSIFYNLKDWDNFKRDEADGMPAIIDFAGKSDYMSFHYKTCQPDWKFDKAAKASKGSITAEKDSAFMFSKDSKGELTGVYSFGHPLFEAGEHVNDDDEFKWALKFESKEMCKDDTTKPYTFTINGVCDESKEEQDFTERKGEACSGQASYKGKEACFQDVDLGKFIALMMKFLGAILIVNGIALLFFGSRYIFVVMSLVTGLFVFGVIVGGAYNVGVLNDPSKGKVIGVGALGLVAGVLAAYFGHQLAVQYAVAILSSSVGVVGGLVFTKRLDNPIVTIIACVILGGLSFKLGQAYNKYIKSIGTAVIGAFCLLTGIFSYATPPNPELKEDRVKSIGVMVATILATCLGSFVQLKYIAPDDEAYKSGDGMYEDGVGA